MTVNESIEIHLMNGDDLEELIDHFREMTIRDFLLREARVSELGIGVTLTFTRETE